MIARKDDPNVMKQPLLCDGRIYHSWGAAT